MASDRHTPADRIHPVAEAELRLDHVLIGSHDLEAGCTEVERLTGVRPGAGGNHPQWGSHNALLALGPACYLELVALRPAAPAVGPFAALRELARVAPIGWAVATTDTAWTRRRLERAGFALTAVTPGARERPDGSRLAWTTFGFEARPFVGTLPFFIEWAPGTVHPASDSPSGCALRRLRILGPGVEAPGDRELGSKVNPPRLRELLGPGVEWVEAATPGLEVTLDTPKGPVTLGG